MRLLSESAWALALRMVSFGSAASTGIITARLLGPAGRGEYQLPIIASSLGVGLCSGLTTAVAYRVAKNGIDSALFRHISRSALVFTLVGIAMGALTAAVLHQFWLIGPTTLFAPIGSLAACIGGYWLGTRRIRSWATFNASISAATLALTFLALMLFGTRPAVAIGAWILASAIVVAIGAAFVVRDGRRRVAGVGVGPPIMRFAFKTGATNVVTLLNYRVDVLIVAAWTSAAVLGAYTVAIAIAESVLALAQTVASVISPRVAAAQRKEAIELTSRAVRNTFFIAGVMCVFLAIVAPQLVAIAFGARFETAATAVRLLLPGIVALSIGGILSSFFTLQLGRPMIPLTIAAASAIVCAVLTLLLIPAYGINGAALATSITYGVGQAVALACYCRITERSVASVLLLQHEDVVRYWLIAIRLRHRLWRRPPIPNKNRAPIVGDI